MGHPDLSAGGQALKQKRFRISDIKHGSAIFPRQGSLNLSTELVGKILGAVANAQKGIFALNSAQVNLWGVGVPDRTRAA